MIRLEGNTGGAIRLGGGGGKKPDASHETGAQTYQLERGIDGRTDYLRSTQISWKCRGRTIQSVGASGSRDRVCR